jgi:hypothetical protein
MAIYKTDGKEVYKTTINSNKHVVDTHNFAEGLYLIQVNNKAGKQKSCKFLKK